jgi:hypothetical protein
LQPGDDQIPVTRIRNDVRNLPNAPTDDDTVFAELMRDAYEANVAKNAASRKESKAREALLRKMREMDGPLEDGQGAVDELQATVALSDGRLVTLTAVYGTPTSYVVNPAKLKKKVPAKVFAQCIRVAKTDAEKHVDADVILECSDEVKGKPAVKVGVPK